MATGGVAGLESIGVGVTAVQMVLQSLPLTRTTRLLLDNAPSVCDKPLTLRCNSVARLRVEIPSG